MLSRKSLIIIGLLLILGSGVMSATSSEWYSISVGAEDCASQNYKTRTDADGSRATSGPTENNTQTYISFLVGLIAGDTTPPDIKDLKVDNNEVQDGDFIGANSVLTCVITDQGGINSSLSKITIAGKNSGTAITTTFNNLTGGSSFVNDKLTYQFSNLPDDEYTIQIYACDNFGNQTNRQIKLNVRSEMGASAYPNPYDPSAGDLTLGFLLPNPASVKVLIFNSVNNLIYRRDLEANAGYLKINWNGRNNWGEIVDNGAYIIRLVVNGQLRETVKVAVSRTK